MRVYNRGVNEWKSRFMKNEILKIATFINTIDMKK